MSFPNYINYRDRNYNNKLKGINNEQFNPYNNSFLNSNFNNRFNNNINKNNSFLNQNYNSYNPYDNDILDLEEEKNELDDDYSYEKEKKDLKNQYNFSNKVMNDFKNILEQTKIIKNKILLKSKDIENNIFNKSYFESKTNNYLNTTHSNNYYTKINNSKDLDIELDDYLINDSFTNHINNTETKSTFTNYIDTNQSLKDILKNKNKVLSNINSQIILQNNLLESEISLYEKKNNNNKNLFPNKQSINNTQNIFDQSLQKFINNLKASLKNNIDSNKDIGDKLITELIKFHELNENNINQRNRYDNLKIKLQKQKEKIADIQKYNKENNKRYMYLKDEHNILTKNAGRLKSNLLNLKSKEKNLSLKKETDRKNNYNKKEIIQALQKTINNLKNQNSSNNTKKVNNTNKLSMNKNSLSLYDDKLNQLYSIIENLKEEKNLINEENMKMKNEIEKTGDLGLVGKNNKLVKENELKVELNELKLSSYNIEKQIKEKDESIKKMQNIIKQFTSDVNNVETENKELKKQIFLLLKTNDEKIPVENQISLNENAISKEINEKLNLDIKLNEEIKSEMKKYDEIINKKDKEILTLEKEIGKKEHQNKENQNIQLKKENKIENDNNVDENDFQNENEEYEDNYENNEELDEMENQYYNDHIEENDEEYYNPEEYEFDINSLGKNKEDEKEENLEEFYQNKNYADEDLENISEEKENQDY